MAEDPQKKEILAPPKMTILSDHPILREEDGKIEPDSFTLPSRLGAVYDIIRHKNTRPPLAVAIYGDWGTGKSSAMRWLSDALEQWSEQDEDERKGHARIRTVWFDPWKYAKREDVWRGLISEVILESLPREGAPFKRVLRAVRNFGHSLGRAFIDTVGSIELTGGVEGNIGVGQVSGEAKFDLAAFSKILDDYRERSQPEKAYLNEFETALQDWVEDSLEEDERMVLFIDDLDRCLPGVVLEVLEALKLYLNIPQLIFVVGLDRDVVESVVEKHYAEQGLGKAKAKHYLDKMFQVEVEIPPSQTLMAGYITGQIEAMDAASEKYWSKSLKGWDTKYKKIIEGKITDLAAHNPREVKRLLNSTLLRATAAARDDNLGGTEVKRFAQGCQVYLIHCYLKKYVPKSGGLLRENAILHFLKAWSDFISEYLVSGSGDRQAEGQAILHLREENLFGTRLRAIAESESLNVDDTPGRSSSGDAHPVGVAYARLRRSAPRYRDDEAAVIPLLGRDDLWDLLIIPFSATVAAAAIIPPSEGQESAEGNEERTEHEFPSEEEGEGPAAVEMSSESAFRGSYLLQADRRTANLPAALLVAIAHKLRKPVNELQPEDVRNLRELDLSSSDITSLIAVSRLPWLRSLDLRYVRVADLSPLSALSDLRWLYLDGVPAADLSPLSGLVDLRVLSLVFMPVTDLFALSGLRAMTELNLTGTPITSVAELASLGQLQDLDLSETNVGDSSPLSNLTALRSLRLTSTLVDDISPLSVLTGLTCFALEGTKVSNLKPLRGLTALRSLLMDAAAVEDITPLEELVDLRTLVLSNTLVTELGPLRGLVALEEFYAYETKLADLSALSAMAALKRISVFKTQVSDLSPLSGLVNLQELWLRDTLVTDVSPLSGLANLRRLDIRRCSGITDAALEALAGCKNLTFIETEGTQITDAALKRFLATREPG